MVSTDARRVQRWHLWLTVTGLTVAVFAMLAGGLVVGLTWGGGGSAGVPAVGDGFESTADAMWNYGFAIARMVGVMTIAVAQALLFSYAAVAWFLSEDRDAVLALDPDLDTGGQEVNVELEVPESAEPTWLRVGSIALAAGIAVFVLVVVLPAQEAESAQPTILADESRIYVEGADVTIGRDIYIREGCVHCHSQAVRPIVTDLGLGPVSVAGDYAHEQPVLLGVARMGPDLKHVASRGGVIAEQLTEPRSARPWSTMPAYEHLSQSEIAALVSYINGLR
jgi:mono/diheme cytochrome c family protein